MKVVWNHMSSLNYSMVAVLSLQPITHPTFHLDLQEHHLLKSCRWSRCPNRIHMCLHILISLTRKITLCYKQGKTLPSLPPSPLVLLPLFRNYSMHLPSFCSHYFCIVAQLSRTLLPLPCTCLTFSQDLTAFALFLFLTS